MVQFLFYHVLLGAPYKPVLEMTNCFDYGEVCELCLGSQTSRGNNLQVDVMD